MNKKVLVCGGAGYIGSHTARLLTKRGYEPVIMDNLTTGHKDALPPGSTFYQVDCRERHLVRQILEYEKIDTIFHFAACSIVAESTENPRKYFTNNLNGTLALLEAMLTTATKKIVFSSSAAVYGNPEEIPIPDSQALEPINPYGESKMFIEKVLERYATAYGIKAVSLRYFNACGAWPDGSQGEDHHPETHLIPLVLKTALKQRDKIQIYGEDYPTRDGTPIRDYIHITDLAEAHLLAREYMESFSAPKHYNLGNGAGFSVKEVVQAAAAVTGCSIPFEISPRRPGDPAILVADAQSASAELGWKPELTTMEEMIESAWEWHKRHPHGFTG
ncbi:UDP-glucose 4-epimerase GalE [candidate division CSSED10-310 bacterium]|uniref:UDP-glucose 4-epimerase n=1 Tax=candidate division CSSED10-310 bacterium TaxID=2855610 RepID=A0ABV6YVB4_UNCC1